MKRKTVLFLSAAMILAGCSSSAEPEHTEYSDTTGETLIREPENAAAAPDDREPEPEIAFEPFRGVEKDEAPINTVNYKNFQPAIVCGDGEYTYISWDGAVYRYKENMEAPEPLFGKNAYDLNYRNGGLYFIEDDHYDLRGADIVHNEGIPYRYDLSSGELTRLSEESVASLFVCGEGIFYTDFAAAGDPLPSGVCRLDEQTGSSERLYDGYRYLEYGGYELKWQWGKEEKVYFSRDGDSLLLEGVCPDYECICGDYYYYKSRTDGTLNRVSMLTGEALTLRSGEEEPDERDRLFSCRDYTVLDDKIYFADLSGGFYRYDETENAFIDLSFGCSVEYLYADGKNLYAAVHIREGERIHSQLRFARLTVSETSADCTVLL